MLQFQTSFNRKNVVSCYRIGYNGDKNWGNREMITTRLQAEDSFSGIVNDAKMIFQLRMEGTLYIKPVRKGSHGRKKGTSAIFYGSKSRVRGDRYLVKIFYPLPRLFFEHLVVFHFLCMQLEENENAARLKKIHMGILEWMLVRYFTMVSEEAYASELHKSFYKAEKAYAYVEKILGAAAKKEFITWKIMSKQLLKACCNFEHSVSEEL